MLSVDPEYRLGSLISDYLSNSVWFDQLLNISECGDSCFCSVASLLELLLICFSWTGAGRPCRLHDSNLVI